MSLLFQCYSYLNYWLDACDAHSLHSPFFYRFYTEVILSKSISSATTSIEAIRQDLLNTTKVIQVEDFGAGARYTRDNNRSIADIARTSLAPQKYSQLYQRIIQHHQLKSCLELGTSLGINSLYMADNPCQVHTIEGSRTIASIAQSSYSQMSSTNIHLYIGTIEEQLNNVLEKMQHIDFALIDANHRYQPTLNYFHQIIPHIQEQTILVLDDIYLSRDMTHAWHDIKSHPKVTATIDLFRCGIVLFNPILDNQHLVLAF